MYVHDGTCDGTCDGYLGNMSWIPDMFHHAYLSKAGGEGPGVTALIRVAGHDTARNFLPLHLEHLSQLHGTHARHLLLPERQLPQHEL